MRRFAVRRRGAVGLLIAAAVATALFAPGEASAARGGKKVCKTRVNDTYREVLSCIRVNQVRVHQAQLQRLADRRGDGTRAAGTPGYTASVRYVASRLRKAGWNVELHEFPFTFVPPSTLRQLTPVDAEYETGAFTGSGTGDVTGTVIPVDINLVPPRASTSGCEAADFTGLDFSGRATSR